MSRPQVSSRVRLEIKAYKKMNPKASLMEIAREFEPKIGRLVMRPTIMNILKEEGGWDDQKINVILDKANDKIAQSIANKIARMGLGRQEILAKATDLINRQLDNEEHLSINDTTRVLSEVTKIDQVLKGQPSEIHKIIRSIDDETLEFLSNFKPSDNNGAIPGEIIENDEGVARELSNGCENGAREAEERRED